MKHAFLSLMAFVSFASAGDLDLAKQEFQKFQEYQKTNDPRILAMLADDGVAEINMNFRGATQQFEAPLATLKAHFEKRSGEKDKDNEVYENASFKEEDGKVKVAATARDTKNNTASPIDLEFAKRGEEMKIVRVASTQEMPVTQIKCHDVFEFTMPMSWKTNEAPKIDLEDGTLLYPGDATAAHGSVVYFAFLNEATTPGRALEDIPQAVAGPMLKRFQQKGGIEQERKIEPLIPGDKDRVYYIITLKGPSDTPLSLQGIVVRGKKSIFAIQHTSMKPFSVGIWREAAKSLKEL